MILRILLVVILMTGFNKKDLAENNNPLNGTFTSNIDVNGQVREYLIHIPNAYDRTQSVPIMLNFHGWNMSGNDQMNLSDMRALSESEQFILVYPQGSLFFGSTHWNVGSWTTGSNSNYIGFILF
jgi:polyhydroxybutyrate depolymerase